MAGAGKDVQVIDVPGKFKNLLITNRPTMHN